MNYPEIRKSFRSAAITTLVAIAVAAAPAASLADDRAARAVALYDDGDYGAAQTVLEQLDAEGKITGPLLYRLYYCLNAKRDPRARPTLERARTVLLEEAETSRDLETFFYLSNTMSNLGQVAETRRAAGEATRRVESGELPSPETALDKFRLGKLYADQGNDEKAEEGYRAALDAFDAEGDSAIAPYVQWASRYLAARAFDAGDYGEAEKALARLTSGDAPSPADLDRLAIAQVRQGRFVEAQASWKKAEKLDPVNANRPRYCARLAALAIDAGGMTALAPDGSFWSDLTKAELEALMKDNAGLVKEKLLKAAELKASDPASEKKKELAEAERLLTTAQGREKRTTKKRIKTLRAEIEAAQAARAAELQALQDEVDALRPVFVTAALEYALAHHSIREAAFFGGYAPLIFKREDWNLMRP